MTDLNDALIHANSGWILTAATAINDNGDIVGSGLLDGQVHGFLLTTGQAPPARPAGRATACHGQCRSDRGRVPLTVNFSSAGSS